MAKVLIVYATRTGETQTIADLIAEGIRFSGHEAEVVSVKEIKNEAALEGYDGYVFGSSTYHGEMLQGMKTFLFMAEKAGLAGKTEKKTGHHHHGNGQDQVAVEPAQKLPHGSLH